MKLKTILKAVALVFAFATTTQAQTPIASYSFTGNANDASANANHAIVNGATLTADRFGNANSAYSFDGVSNFINIPHIAAYNTSSFSISMWYKFNGPGTAGKSYWSLMGKNDNGSGFFSTYQLHIDANNKLGGRIGGGSLAQNIDWSTNATINNDWHQVTYVFNNTKDSIYVYQDGVESYRNYFPFNTFQNSDPITLGVWNPYQNYFNGSIDEVNIFGDALSAAQVLQNYNNSIGLVAYYPLNGNAIDASGNALNGTNTGTVTPAADRFGNANSANSFNGASRIDVADNTLLHPTNVTLSAWVYFTSIPGTQVIANKNIANSTFESYAIFFFNGNIAAAWGNPSTVQFMTGPVPSASQWHFVAMTFDDVNNLASLYLDGVLVNSQTSNLTLGYDNSTFSIATELENGSYNFFFNGIIDEVKIYNTALTASQIQQEFQTQPNFTNTLITNGSTTFATTPAGMLQGATDFTIETWIKTTESKSDGTFYLRPTLIGNGRSQFADNDIAIFTNGGNIGMYAGLGAENVLQTAVPINDNQWHHIAAVKIGAILNLYVDGVNVGNTAVGASNTLNTSDAPITIGGAAFNFSVPGLNTVNISCFHQGEFAETRFSNIARYAANFIPAGSFTTDANTVALYHYGACQREICTDVSGNANFLSGRFSAPSCATTLPFNNAISYNGLDQKAFLPNGVMNGLTNFTIEGWIKSNDVNTSATGNLWEAPVIVSEENPVGASGDLVLVTQAGYLGMTYEGQGNGVTSDVAKYFISDNQWHHWAASADGSTIRFFVDGIIQGSRPVGGGLTIGATDKFALMGDDNLNTYFAKNHSGLLEEVRFSNTARYTGNFIPPIGIFTSDANTVALYHSDDCPNNNLTDASSNNNTATLQNFNGSCQGIASQEPGSGNAISFDGLDDHITTGVYVVPTFGDFTTELWVYCRNNSNGFREFISQGASGDAFYIGTTNLTGIIRLGDKWQNTNVLMPLNQWVHLAVVKSGTNGTFYLNGIQVATQSNYSISTAGTHTFIGRQYGGLNEFPDANMDEIRVWNTALSEAQIRDRMCRKITNSDALYNNLVAYYNFDESSGNAAIDGTVNANNGLLLNGPTRVTSGAAIGNISTHNYVNTGLPSANLSFIGQDNLAVAYTAGTYTGEAGTHIYVVNEKPNTVAGINGVGTNDRYFGVFNANLTSPSYTAVYNYDGNPFVTGSNENLLALFKRNDNAVVSWVSAIATLNTAAKTLSATGQNTEYMLGTSNCTKDSVHTTATACDSLIWNGNTLTVSGLYSALLVNQGGCDSVVTLDLTINNSAATTINQTACDTVKVNGVSYITSGTYTQVFSTVSGCDSILTINVIITTRSIIVLRSGNGNIGQSDSVIHMLVGPDDAGFGTIFTPADFAAARIGAAPIIILNHPAWLPTLPADPQAKWINNTGSNGTGNSALLALDFEIITPFTAAKIDFSFAVDNLLGGGVNQGLYINGTPVSGNTTFGTYSSQFQLTRTDIAPLLVQGTNTLYVNFSDLGSPGGIVYSATITTTNNTSEFADTACGSYTWNGIVYNTTGQYSQTFSGSGGCDSTVLLNLTMVPQITWYLDADADGFYSTTQLSCNNPGLGWTSTILTQVDCDDNDFNIHAPVSYFADNDLDGFGSTTIQLICASTPPIGFSLNNTDCDDNNTNIHEPVQYFVDADHDGFGSTATQLVCETTPPVGFSLNNTDCDDNNVNINTPVSYFVDADNDGFGSTATQLVCATTPPIGFSLNNTDCNDGNANINPGATETCNGIDDNCNGTIDEGVKITFYEDFDNDGFGNNAVSQIACTAPLGYVLSNTDCNDTSNAINPNAIEICNNGIDENCDGQIDEGCNVPHTYYEDMDEDGFGNINAFIVSLDTVPPLGYVTDSTDCDDLNDFIFPGQIEYCNSVDDDCDGLIDDDDSNVQLLSIWYQDLDNDGYGNENITVEQCDQPIGYAFIPGDCNDNDYSISPDAIDYCNLIDDNCDGIIDNGFNTPPTLSFLGTGAYTNSLVDRPVGNPTDVYKFRVLFTDADNDVHLGGYPKLLFDYEGDGIYTGSFDKQYVLQESDVNDVLSSDGKEYFINLSYFKPGLDYHLQVVAYDDAGCLDSLGPFNSLDILELPNAFLYASDITMSNYNPDPGDTVTIQAQIHYTSLNSAFDTLNPLGIIIVHLLSENETYKSFADDTVTIGSTNTIAEWTVIANDTGGWYPFRVYIDYPDQIIEANEFDNDAVRAYVVGKDALGGKIDITANASPASQYVSQGASVSICGHASYSNIPVILSNYNVAGAEVSVTLIETGQIYKGTTNSNGDFCVSFSVPVAVGIYHVSISITDFTLIGVCPNPPTFELLQPACILDLAASLQPSTTTIVQGDLMSVFYGAGNSGCQDITLPTVVNYSAPGSTLSFLTDTINQLTSGATQSFNTGDFTYNTPGIYQIEVAVDANNDLVEINENNNYTIQTITVLPNIPDIVVYEPFIADVKPQAPGTQVFQCLTYPIRFVVSNIGGGSTGSFLARGVITNLTANTTDTFDFTVPGMTRFSDFTHIVNYDFTYLGNYKIDFYADIPLYNGVVSPELSENNNFILGQSFEVIECKPDLTVNCFYITPKDPEITGNVTANFVASNIGTLPVTQSFDVTCNVNSVTYTQTVTTQIPVGASHPMTFTFPTPPQGTGFPLLITLDQNNVINEFDESNNAAGTTLCYDFIVTNKSCKDLEYWEVPHMVDSPVVFSIPYHTGSYLPSLIKMKFEVKGPGILDGNTFFDIGIQTQNSGDIINPCAVEKVCLNHFNSNVPFFFPEPGEYYVRSTIDPQDLYPECNENNNSIIDTLQITNLPDYQVLSQYINPSLLNPNTGQPVTINVTYENVGANDIGSNVVHQLQVDNSILQDKPVSSMIGGDIRTTVFDSTWMSNIPGTHIMRTTIDPYNTIVEGNESNNTATRAIIVGDAPNLYWADFDAGLVNCNPLCQTTFTGKIVNDGDLSMQANVTFYYIDNGSEILIQTNPIQVGANDTIDISYNWQVLINNATIVAKITDASPDETLLSDNDTSDMVSQTFLTLSSTKVTCPGNNNGTATANVSGGVPPYTYAWSNGSTNVTIVAVAGTYTVTVTDAIGYSETQSVTIAEKADNTPPSISNMPANIVVTDTNGNCSEVVNWIPPVIADNCNLANTTSTHTPGDIFPIGTTQVIYSATDAGGLNNTQTFTVTVISNTIWYLDADNDGFGNPNEPKYACSQPSGYVSNNTDCDDSNPNITTGPDVNAGNDTAVCKFNGVQLNVVSNGNQFMWQPATGLNSATISNPFATPVVTTTYTVTVTAGSGCTSSDVIRVTVLGQSPLPVVLSPITYCKNEPSQALTANGVNVLWYDSLTGGTGTATAPTPLTNLVGSVKYYVTQSVNGCESERAEIEVVTNAKPVINNTSVSCNSGTGAITITTFNNVGRMEYSIDGVNYQPSPQFTNVVNGTYIAYLRDTLTQCVTTKSNVKVNCKTCNTITIVGDTVACVGDTIAFEQTGGKQNGYWIANNGGTINISTGVFTANSPGIFAVTYFDDVNFTCFGSITVTVNQVPQIPQVTTPVVYCENEVSQALTAVGTDLIWFNSTTDSIGSTSAPIPDTDIPGSVTYFVAQSGNGCLSTKAQIDVNTIDRPVISNVLKSCMNGKGALNITANASSALSYSLDGVNYQSNSQFANLVDSTYNLYVKTDSGNCVTQMDNIVINCGVIGCNIVINGNTNVCFDATEVYTQSGGNPNGTWMINSNVNTIDPNTGLLTAKKTGDFLITYTDAVTNCSSQLLIHIGKRLAHRVDRTIVTCHGGNDGTAIMIPKDKNMPFQFLWSNGMTTDLATGLTAGMHQVVMTDTNGCQVVCRVTMNQNTRIFFKATVEAASCNGGCDGRIITNAVGGVAPYTYLWSNGETVEKIKKLFAGNYTLTITDSKGCAREKTFVISQPPALNITVVKTNETQPGANDGSIDATTSGGNTPYTYLWSNGKTTAKIKKLPAGSYQVTVTDANECFKRKTIEILSGAPRMGTEVATAITIKPNPASDFLYVSGIEKCTVQIFNSIGVLVYENSLQDGTVPISNLSPGVYSIQFRNEKIIHTQKFVKQ